MNNFFSSSDSSKQIISKTDLLILVGEFIQNTESLKCSPLNEIHLLSGLYNLAAVDYDLPFTNDSFEARISPEISIAFRQFVEEKLYHPSYESSSASQTKPNV